MCGNKCIESVAFCSLNHNSTAQLTEMDYKFSDRDRPCDGRSYDPHMIVSALHLRNITAI